MTPNMVHSGGSWRHRNGCRPEGDYRTWPARIKRQESTFPDPRPQTTIHCFRFPWEDGMPMEILGTFLLWRVPFWQRSRGRRVARWVALASYLYLASLLVLVALEDRLLFPGATVARAWRQPPDCLHVRELTLDSTTG